MELVNLFREGSKLFGVQLTVFMFMVCLGIFAVWTKWQTVSAAVKFIFLRVSGRNEQRFRQVHSELTEQLDSLKSQLIEEQSRANEYEADHKRFLRLRQRYRGFATGTVWLSPARRDATPFRELTKNKPPIIAVFNLKGGVGKTTIATGLASTWWDKGQDVILLDLDYQGSATDCMLTDDQVDMITASPGGVGVQALLEGQIIPDAAPSFDVASPLGPLVAVQTRQCKVQQLRLRVGNGRGYIIPALDPLDQTENRLLIKWAFGGTADDVRFRLRAALHARSVQDKYQRIILDCPPRLTAASVNGLVSADFLLIPVTPNPLATKAVVRLLTYMKKIRKVNPHLKVLGIVPNKVHNSAGMSAREKSVWTRLGLDVTGTREDCPLFDEFIPGVVALGNTGGSPLVSLPQNVADNFQKLAERIDSRILELE